MIEPRQIRLPFNDVPRHADGAGCHQLEEVAAKIRNRRTCGAGEANIAMVLTGGLAVAAIVDEGLVVGSRLGGGSGYRDS